jgi:hypothetical protein
MSNTLKFVAAIFVAGLFVATLTAASTIPQPAAVSESHRAATTDGAAHRDANTVGLAQRGAITAFPQSSIACGQALSVACETIEAILPQ